MFNSQFLIGKKIKANWAKFRKYIPYGKRNYNNFNGRQDSGRKFQQLRPQTKWVWKREQTIDPHMIVQMSQEHSPQKKELKLVKGAVSEEKLNWLRRSLICEFEVPRDLGMIETALHSELPIYTKIYDLGQYKFILTFQNEEEMEEVFQNHRELDQWFSSVRKWNTSAVCETRRTWIEVLDPPTNLQFNSYCGGPPVVDLPIFLTIRIGPILFALF